ncbi:MAG: ketoacyl-ACP synthase III [Tannerellaceae bacterium]|jgi:3-oxoacyl-[acyl-carrier-protein] synthase-3|nr:ketoacyl-ACP synthase III [Tannerellaceae bacterium]
MAPINAVITGIGGYVPDEVLTNQDLEQMVDTSDEWITTRVGVKERRILRGEGKGLSFMAVRAVRQLLEKTRTDPSEVEIVVCATTTPDYAFPTTASIIAYETGCTKAFTFDMQAACSGFLYGLETAANFIRAGRYKKVILVAGEKMTSITDYTDRNTAPLFGDGCGAVLIEPTEEDYGLIDSILKTDGIGRDHLIMRAGGSVLPLTHEGIDKRLNYIYQDGKFVFKYAVACMADVAAEIVERNHLSKEEVDWVVPHQANKRIIDAAGKRLGVPEEKIMVNIEKFGNTSAGSIPLCLWEWENRLRKGDNMILAAFGAGFVYGAAYLKWGYDGQRSDKGQS